MLFWRSLWQIYRKDTDSIHGNLLLLPRWLWICTVLAGIPIAALF